MTMHFIWNRFKYTEYAFVLDIEEEKGEGSQTKQKTITSVEKWLPEGMKVR